MKQLIYTAAVCTVLTLGCAYSSSAQATPPPHVYHVTNWTITIPEGGSRAEMDSLSKEYMEKVIKKNPLIVHEWHFRHFFTGDNREYMIIDEFNALGDIQSAFDMFADLEKQAWPDQKKREAFLDRFGLYFNHHSDRIYGAIAGLTKEGPPTAPATAEEHIFNFQTNYMKPTKKADRDVRDALNKDLFQKIDMKNDMLLSQRHMTHFFTSDSQEYMILTEYKSLTDMEAAFKKDEAMMKAAFTDEQVKKNDKEFAKYFSHHGDALYHSVPGLSK